MKKDLREYAKEVRKNIVNKKEQDSKIREALFQEEAIITCKNVLIYVSFGDEIDTYGIIYELLKVGKNVYVPKVCGGSLEFYHICSLSDLALGKFGIMEPTTNEKLDNYHESCIIVPGLMFDSNLNRLGYGGGYYDHFLNDKNIFKIGLCYQELLIDFLEAEAHDVPMDLVVTQEKKKLVSR